MPAKGEKQIRKRLRIAARNAQAAMDQSIQDSAEDLLSRARVMAPQLSGDLILSGDIRKTRGAGGATGRIVFFDEPYAVIRHEDVYNLGPISRTKSSPDGPIGRKYLERPFRNHQARYVKDARDAVLASLRRTFR